MTDDAPLRREPGWYRVARHREWFAMRWRPYSDGDGTQGEWNTGLVPHEIGERIYMPDERAPGEPAPKTITCPTCDGREGDMLDQPCPQCEGWGYVTPTGYIAYLIEDRNNSNRLLDECRHERNVLQKICAERSDEIERLAAPKAEAGDFGLIAALRRIEDMIAGCPVHQAKSNKYHPLSIEDIADERWRDPATADPVALLLAEAERLRNIPNYPQSSDTASAGYNDWQERQRLARCYQDAAKLLGESWNG